MFSHIYLLYVMPYEEKREQCVKYLLKILTHNRPDSLQYYSSEIIQVSVKKGLIHTLVHILFSYTPNILLIDIHTVYLKQVSFCSTTGRGWSLFKGLFKTLSLRYKRPNPRVSVHLVPVADIAQVRVAKLLGVVLCDSLLFDEHVHAVLKTCS